MTLQRKLKLEERKYEVKWLKKIYLFCLLGNQLKITTVKIKSVKIIPFYYFFRKFKIPSSCTIFCRLSITIFLISSTKIIRLLSWLRLLRFAFRCLFKSRGVRENKANYTAFIILWYFNHPAIQPLMIWYIFSWVLISDS